MAVACAAAESPEPNSLADGGGGVSGALAGGQSNPENTSGGARAAAGSAGQSNGGASPQAPAAMADGGEAEDSIGGAYGVIGAGGDNFAAGPRPPSPDVCQTSADAATNSAGALLVRVKANSDQPTEFPQGELQVSNEGYSTVELAEVELHYYFQSEYDAEHTDALVVTVDHAQKSGLVHTNIAQEIVHADVRVLEPSVSGANAYFVLAFSSPEGRDGTLSAGETLVVKFRMEPPAGSSFNYYNVPRDQTNDYSFGACPLHASAFSRVVLLRAGEVMSGEPPAGFVVPDASAGAGGMGSGGAPGFDLGGAGGSY